MNPRQRKYESVFCLVFVVLTAIAVTPALSTVITFEESSEVSRSGEKSAIDGFTEGEPEQDQSPQSQAILKKRSEQSGGGDPKSRSNPGNRQVPSVLKRGSDKQRERNSKKRPDRDRQREQDQEDTRLPGREQDRSSDQEHVNQRQSGSRAGNDHRQNGRHGQHHKRELESRTELRDNKGQGDSKSSTAKKTYEVRTLKIGLGPDVLTIEDGKIRKLFDFKEKKTYRINITDGSFSETSLFADLGFRIPELKNRAMLRELLSTAGVGKGDEGLDPFFTECIFGLRMPEFISRSSFREIFDSFAETSEFTHDGKVVCSFKPSSIALTVSEASQLSRFFLYHCQLHPDIRKAIVKKAMTPGVLMYYVAEILGSNTTVLKLRGVTEETVNLVLPRSDSAAHAPDHPLSDIYKLLDSSGYVVPEDSRQNTRKFVDVALADRNFLDVLLAFLEYKMQTGADLDVDLSSRRPLFITDVQCAYFSLGVRHPTNAAEARESLAALDKIDRVNLKKGYVIDICRANCIRSMQLNNVKDIQTRGESSPVKCFVIALQSNPYLTGVYHDLGAALYASSETVFAWDCWDLGRRFYPGHPQMKEIDEMEKSMEQKYPEFFSGDRE